MGRLLLVLIGLGLVLVVAGLLAVREMDRARRDMVRRLGGDR